MKYWRLRCPISEKVFGKDGGCVYKARADSSVCESYMGAVQQLCSRCILLGEGRLRFDSDSKSVVAHYYASGSGDSPEVVWPDLDRAPGDESIRLSSVRLVQDGRACTSIPIDQDAEVQFEFHELRDGHDDLSYSIQVLDSSGYMVFCSNSIAAANSIARPSEFLYRPLPVGKFRGGSEDSREFPSTTRFTGLTSPSARRPPSFTSTRRRYSPSQCSRPAPCARTTTATGGACAS